MLGVRIIESKIVLSIIIPVYNVEKHLENCLESLIDVTVSGIQIILVDDGSTDGSPGICDSYRDRYEFIETVHLKNGCSAAARNAGLRIAEGEYITFLDSDDFVDKGYLRFLRDLLDDAADILAFSYYTDFTETANTSVCELMQASDISAKDALRELEKKGAFNFVWNKVYKKSLLDKPPLTQFPPDTEPGEDLIFNVLCFVKASTVTLINKPYYHWVRRGEDTLANQYRKDLYEKNRMFIAYRDRLYTSLKAEQTDVELLSYGNLKYVFACVPNMYRPGKRFPRAERIRFYRDILTSEEVAVWLRLSDHKGGLLRQFALVYRTHSPFLMDLYYSAAMRLRNSFGSTWNKLRNKMK